MGYTYVSICMGNDLSSLIMFLSDFHFGERQLTKQQCLQNLNRAEGIYSSILSPSAFHLSSGEILRWSQSRILDCNIQALLAHLYYCFEMHTNRKSLAKPMKSNSDGQLQTSNGHSDTGSLSRRQNLLRRSKLLSKGIDNTQKAGLPPQMQLHSFSTSDLNPSVSSRIRQRARPLVMDTQAALVDGTSNQSLSSFSASALVSDAKEVHNSNSSVQSSTTVFRAPIRSSLSVSQAAALSHFDKQSMRLGKGSHSQSSPAIHVSTTLPNLPQPFKQDIITASTDNLMIREQMLASKTKRTTSNTANSSLKPKSLTLPSQSHSASDISGGSGDEFTMSSPGADISGNCTTSLNTATTLPNGEVQEQDPPYQSPQMEAIDFDASAMPMNGNVPPLHSLQLPATESEPQEIARRSFTLDKQHTIASASAAGLPIIGSGKAVDRQEVELLSVNHADMDTRETAVELREEEPLADHSIPQPHVQDKMRSTSLSSSSPTVMCLLVYSDPSDDHAGDERELVPSVPAPVVEQLQLVLNACKDTHVVQERNVLTKQLQVRQKVQLSYMHEAKKRKAHNSTYTSATAGSHHKQVSHRKNQSDSHKTITPTNATHVIIPHDPPAHSVTRVISQPESSGSVGNTRPRDSGILLPQSSTAKKLAQPLRELHLSPIGQSSALRIEDESKPPNKTHLVTERPQPNPWIEVTVGDKGQQTDTVRCEILCDDPVVHDIVIIPKSSDD